MLFDPAPELSDTATYDITAWALPYAYNVRSFALTDKVSYTSNKPSMEYNSHEAGAYGYLVPNNSVNSMKLVADLLEEDFRVRVTEKSFGYKGKTFNAGTFIVLKGDNRDRMEKLSKIISDRKAEAVAVSTGFMDQGIDFGSDKIKNLFKPRVALVSGEGINPMSMGEIWFLFDKELEYPITIINKEDLSATSLKNFDVLILPNGSYSSFSSKEQSAGFKSWVREGGKIIAIEQAVSDLAAGDWGIKARKADDADSALHTGILPKYGDRDRSWLSGHIPGAIYALDLDLTHPITFGQPPVYYALKSNGIILDFSKDYWNVGVLNNTKPVSGFVGSDAKKLIQNGTLIAVQDMGRGSVVYFADNPVFRGFWYGGKALLANSVFLQGR